MLDGDVHAFGRLNVPGNREELAKLPAGRRPPTVIYLHGCAGLRWSYWAQTLGRLRDAGFALIAPDSFALSNRKEVCGMTARDVFAVRASPHTAASSAMQS